MLLLSVLLLRTPTSPLSRYSLPPNSTTHFPLHLSRTHLNTVQWYEWCLLFHAHHTSGLPELHSSAEVLGAGGQHCWNIFPAISPPSNPSCNLIGQISSDIQVKMMPILDKFCYSNVTPTSCHEIWQETCCTLLFQPPEYSYVSVYNYGISVFPQYYGSVPCTTSSRSKVVRIVALRLIAFVIAS